MIKNFGCAALIRSGEDAKVWRPSDWPEIEKNLKRSRA